MNWSTLLLLDTILTLEIHDYLCGFINCLKAGNASVSLLRLQERCLHQCDQQCQHGRKGPSLTLQGLVAPACTIRVSNKTMHVVYRDKSPRKASQGPVLWWSSL